MCVGFKVRRDHCVCGVQARRDLDVVREASRLVGDGGHIVSVGGRLVGGGGRLVGGGGDGLLFSGDDHLVCGGGHHHLAELVKVHGPGPVLVKLLDDAVQLVVGEGRQQLGDEPAQGFHGDESLTCLVVDPEQTHIK